MIPVIPLYSGIGNVIQSLPFVYEMRKRYGRVYAYPASLDYPDVINIIKPNFDLIDSKNNLIELKRLTWGEFNWCKAPKRDSYPEYKAWFRDNNEPLPDKFVTNIDYDFKDCKCKFILWDGDKYNWTCKKWDKFGELRDLLKNKFGRCAVYPFPKKIFLGSQKSDPIVENNFLPLKEVAGYIKNCDIFIGNEGGMSHLAAALGVKTFIIYGCTDPVKCMPPNNAIMISKGLDCQPCQFRGLKEKKIPNSILYYGCDDRKCLTELTAKEVYDSISNHCNW